MWWVALISCLAVQYWAWKEGFYPSLPEPKKTSINLWNTLAAFALYFGLSVLIILAWQKGKFTDELSAPLSPQSHGWLAVSTMTGASLGLLIFSSWMKGIWGSNGFSKWIRGCLSWFLAFPIVFAIDQLFSAFYPIPDELQQDAIRILLQSKQFPAIFAGTIIGIVVLIPLAEEILFRGFLQTFLRQKGRVFAIMLSSLFFAAMHFSWAQGIANVQLLVTLFALSCFLGYLYEKECSLWASVGLHMTFNGVTVIFLTSGLV